MESTTTASEATERLNPVAKIRAKDRIGHRFGYLVITGFVRKQGSNYRFAFKCDCGKECELWFNDVRRGKKLHCGCMSTRFHGNSKLREFGIWTGMKQRCENPKCLGYRNYGGRGIRVCERWQDFRNFIADMGLRPSNDHSIDRIDPNGNYEPGNCRWILKRDQGRTKRREMYRWHTVCGITLYASDWATVCGIGRERMRQRFSRLPDNEAVLFFRKAREWFKSQHGIDPPEVVISVRSRSNKVRKLPLSRRGLRLPEDQLPEVLKLLEQARKERWRGALKPIPPRSNGKFAKYDRVVSELLAKDFPVRDIVAWFAERGIEYGQVSLANRIKHFHLGPAFLEATA